MRMVESNLIARVLVPIGATVTLGGVIWVGVALAETSSFNPGADFFNEVAAQQKARIQSQGGPGPVYGEQKILDEAQQMFPTPSMAPPPSGDVGLVLGGDQYFTPAVSTTSTWTGHLGAVPVRIGAGICSGDDDAGCLVVRALGEAYSSAFPSGIYRDPAHAGALTITRVTPSSIDFVRADGTPGNFNLETRTFGS